MSIQMAHLREQGIDFAVFNADAQARTSRARSELLRQLTAKARLKNLRVQKPALAYEEGGRTRFYGSADLVRFLENNAGAIRWTHKIDC